MRGTFFHMRVSYENNVFFDVKHVEASYGYVQS